MTYKIQYFPYFTPSEIKDAEREHPRYRVHPKGQPDLWLMETNWEAPNRIQMEAAWLLCEALNDLKPESKWLRWLKLLAVSVAAGAIIAMVLR